MTFFPSNSVFQDLETRRMIGGGHEAGGLYSTIGKDVKYDWS